MYCTQFVFVRSLNYLSFRLRGRGRRQERQEPTQLAAARGARTATRSVHPAGTMGICVAGGRVTALCEAGVLVPLGRIAAGEWVLASSDSLCKGFLGPRLRMLELCLRILYLRL